MDTPIAGETPRPGVEFQRLLDTLPAAAYTCDAGGLITYYNDNAVRLWGRAPKLNDPIDRFCGSFKLFHVDGDAIAHADCWMALALRNGRQYIGQEILIERPDGMRVTALAHASPVLGPDGRLEGAVNVLVDVTEHRLSERELVAAKEQLALQLSDLTRLHAISMRLTPHRDLRHMLHDTLEAALALEGKQMGMLSVSNSEGDCLELGASIGFDDRFVRAMARVLPGGGPCGASFQQRRRVVVEDVETDPNFLDHRQAAREAGFRSMHCTPLITRAGQVIGVLSTHAEVPRRPTEREMHLTDLCVRQAVDLIENAQLYEQLQEADRRKDEFLATLAHELRNPMAPIRNALEIMKHCGDDPEAGQRALQIMERQLGQMVRITDDLLDVSRISRDRLELHREALILATVIRTAVETSSPLIEAARHRLRVSQPLAPVRVHADPIRLAQVISNLLNNAAKYTSPEGAIDLVVEPAPGSVAIHVKDNGLGIAPEALPHLFDPFTPIDRRVDRPYTGLGIGLTLVKRLVELHGGHVRAASAGPGQGSEFTVTLPTVGEPEIAPTPPFGPRAGRPRRVLVVDDNQDALESMAMLLELMGSTVRTGRDGHEALRTGAEFRPEVVLMDLGMPNLDGFEVARLMREESWGRNVSMIALTGWGQEEVRRRTRMAGFDHHLVKPVDPAELERLLSNLNVLSGPESSGRSSRS